MEIEAGATAEIAALCLSVVEKQQLEALLSDVIFLKSCIAAIQHEDFRLHHVRDLFDSIIRRLPTITHLQPRFSTPRAKIVVNPDFEAALFKISRNKTTTSTQLTVDNNNNRLDRGLDRQSTVDLILEEMALKRKRTGDEAFNHAFISVKFIPPTSCIAERFFSNCKTRLTENKQRISFRQFEAQSFLAVNADFLCD